MGFNKNELLKFKQFFHGNHAATFQLFPEPAGSDGRTGTATFKLSPQRIAKIRRLNRRNTAVCMMINGGDGKGRSKNNVVKVTALFADADGNVELEALKNAPISPHLIVQTSPGHYHAYWKVEGVATEQFEELQKRLASIFGSDKQVCDLPRVMRAPGTLNWKTGKPYRVRIVHLDEDAEPIRSESICNLFGEIRSSRSDGGGEGGGQEETIKIAAIRTALTKVPSEDREVWLRVGMAIHSELPNPIGRQLWDEWSQQSKKFKSDIQGTTWRNFKAGGPIKLPTLFYLAGKYAGTLSTTGQVWPRNEIELGQLFAKNHTDVLRYVQSEDAWYSWDGARWKKDKIAAQNFAQAFLLSDRDTANDTGRRGDSALSVANARNILQAARVEAALKATRADFDANPNILAVRNGVIDLPTRTFRSARPSDMVSYCANVEFDPEATCPIWLKFLDQITCGDEEMQRFMRRAAGYTLYGHMAEHKMFVLVGSGRNGKSTFLHVLDRILGDYSSWVQSSLLRPNYGNANGPTPALTAIKGRRLVISSEMMKNKSFDEAFVKQLTGGDPVSSRGLYADQEVFLPICKVWLLVNNMPKVRFDDYAMWSRIVPIPFRRRFQGKKRDLDLENKLLAESPGILNWALRGAELYGKEGRLYLPEQSKKFRKTLKRKVNTVGAWVDSECKRKDDGEIQAKVAYGSYTEFVKAEKGEVLSREEFKVALMKNGFTHRKRNRFNVYEGLKLRAA